MVKWFLRELHILGPVMSDIIDDGLSTTSAGDSPADGNLSNVVQVDFTPRIEQCQPVELVDNIDVAFVLWAVNMFGIQQDDPEGDDPFEIISMEDIYMFRPEFTIECLMAAIHSDMLTDHGKEIIHRILATSNIYDESHYDYNDDE
jgi:hypothetical protein